MFYFEAIRHPVTQSHEHSLVQLATMTLDNLTGVKAGFNRQTSDLYKSRMGFYNMLKAIYPEEGKLKT